MTESAEEAHASASVPVIAVVVGEVATRAVHDAMVFRAFHTRATSPGGMQLSRGFTATVKGFNERYGTSCRNWAQVAEVTTAVYALIKRAQTAGEEA